MLSETPSNSRPLYEVLLTGVPTYENGIYTNYSVQRSKEKSIFSLAKEAGMTTAAAAYHWVSELYNRAPYSMFEDRSRMMKQKIFNMVFFTQRILIQILTYFRMLTI